MKIACFGNFGVHNLGDDLILMGLLEVFKGHELIVFCGNPERVKTQFQLKSHAFFPSGIRSWIRYLFSSPYRQQLREGCEALRNCDRIVIGGGGILVDRLWRAILLWWRQLSVIRSTNKPYEFMANSFELNRWWTKKLFFPFLKSAAKITVRDSTSQHFIEALGLKAERVKDLSSFAAITDFFGIPSEAEGSLGGGKGVASLRTPPSDPSARPRLRRADSVGVPNKNSGIKANSYKLALALCRWGLGEDQQHLLRMFMDARKREGWEIVGLAFQTIGDDDREIFNMIDPNLRIETELEPILYELSTSNLLIGMRLHSLILASRLNVPMIALAYQEKITAFMKDQGKASHVIPLQNVNFERLQGIFKALMR